MLQVHKKLREARFFYGKMVEREQMAFGDHEEADFYLSAFLSAGRTVDSRLRHEQCDAYKTYWSNWNNRLSSYDQCLMKFMVDDRNCEVHDSGSNREETESRIPVHSFYRDKSGTMEVFSPYGSPPAVIIKPTYLFTIGGQQVPVLEACRQYLELLDRLVTEYCASVGLN
jgi:hypothetical protein